MSIDSIKDSNISTENIGAENLENDNSNKIEDKSGTKETANTDSLKDEKGSEEEADNKDTSTEDSFSTAKESSAGAFDTLELTKEAAKIETIIDNKKSNTPNIQDFYKNIENYLSDEDKQLFFEDDKTKYFEAIEKAKEEFLNNQKVDTTEEEEKLEFIKGKLAVADAIETVLKQPGYQDFNFVKLQEFYNQDLTGKERAQLNEGSKKDNLADQLKKVYDLYKQKNPVNIKKVDDPKIPDASNISKTSIEDKQEIDNKKQDEKYKQNIGFRKL